MNNRLRELRTARGWTQAELAQVLKVSRNSVNAIETGRYEPSLSLALKVAKVFALHVEDIFWND
jgi:putative transcriptional regulator